MAYEQTFKNIDNILRTDEGCGSELDYIEQKSWILFLKYLDDLEKTRQMEAMLQDTTYTPIIAFAKELRDSENLLFNHQW